MRHLPCRNYKRHRIVPESSSWTAHLRDLSRLVHCWVSPKETELTYVRPGQPVTVMVDSYPDTQWDGTVESISPAAAQEFSLLPAQNTSGNWVKVVQRIPIRVRVDTSDEYQPPLRAGMSVEVDVDTGHARGWPHFLADMLGDSTPACAGPGPCREPLPSPQAALFSNRQGGR
jgi:Cation efflux system protein CusB domain 1